MPESQTIIGSGRERVQFPIPKDAKIYLPVPIADPQPEGPTHTDGYAHFSDLQESLELIYVVVTNAESPYQVSEVFNLMVNTADGEVEISLPENPEVNQKVRLVPLGNTYETNSLIIRRNGQPIMGDEEDIEVDVDGLALDLVFINATKGWVIIPRGETLNVQRATIMGASLTEKRVTSDENILTTSDDLQKLIVSTGNDAGEITLFDSTTVDDMWESAVLQTGEGNKTFVAQELTDTIIALDDDVTTRGPGSMVQILKVMDGVWFIGGGLGA